MNLEKVRPVGSAFGRLTRDPKKIILFLFWPWLIQAGDLRFDHLSSDEGLSQTHIFCVVQDRLGFMWFGTEEGLNRYDGYDFEVFKHNPNDPGSLSDNVVTAALEDDLGRLWFGTKRGGLNRFNQETREFERFQENSSDPGSLTTNEITVLLQGQNGYLWVGTLEGGLLRCKVSDEEPVFERFSVGERPLSLGSPNITALAEDGSGALLIGTEEGLLYHSIQDAQGHRIFQPIALPFSEQKTGVRGERQITSILPTSSGIWVGASSGLFRIQGGVAVNYSVDRAEDFPRNIRCLLYDSNDTLWIGTRGRGMARVFETGKDQFAVTYFRASASPTSLTSDIIWCLYVGSAETLWIGTWGGGINKWARGLLPFEYFREDEHNPASLSTSTISAILDDRDNRVWVGTIGGGLNLWERRSGKTPSFKHYRYDPSNSSSISADTVYSILQDRDGSVWVGTRKGLDLRDEDRDGFVHIGQDPSGSEYMVWSLYQDSRDYLWIGTRHNGLFKRDVASGAIAAYHHDPERSESLSNNWVAFTREDSKGNLWVGTIGGGLNLWRGGVHDARSPEEVVFTRFRGDPDDPATLAHDIVYCMHEGSDGVLWFGTNGGLNRMEFDQSRAMFRTYRRDEALSQVIYSILEDGKGYFWMSTNYGISRFDRETSSFKNYDSNDGLQHNEFNIGAYFQSPGGELFFGGMEGLNIFSPESLADNPFLPPVVITDFLISNRHVPLQRDQPDSPLSRSIETTRHFDLDHTDNIITFEFTALHYTSPGKNRYAYRLIGFDPQWIETGSRHRLATFTNLSAGFYEFEVKGSNNDGLWNPEPARVSFRVLPPPWLSWWAYMLYALVAACVVFLAFRLRSQKAKLAYQKALNEALDKKVHERTRELIELNQFKTRFFTNVSHEFRTPLTLTVGPLEDLNAGRFGELSDLAREQVQTALSNMSRLMGLINQVLDVSRLDAGRMKTHFQQGDIGIFVKEQVGLFLSLAERRGVSLIISEPTVEILAHFDKDHMSKVLANLLSNAFKFTSAGDKVLVGAVSEGENVVISVKDTGEGIPADEIPFVFDRFYQASSGPGTVGSGIGLSLSRELVRLHGGDILVQSELGYWTEFQVIFPMAPAFEQGQNPGVLHELNSKPSHPLRHKDDSEAATAISSDQDQPQIEETDAETSRRRPVVLLVEDHEDVRLYIQAHLAEFYDVKEAASAEEALGILAKHLPDIVLSDVMMPGIDGLDFCKMIKSNGKTAELPVILLTAKAADDAKIAALEIGADDYVTKPFKPRELLARVENLIQSRRGLRKRYSKKVLLEPVDVPVASEDELFIKKAALLIEKNMGEDSFGVPQLAEQMEMSRRQLNRRFALITGKGPSDFIKNFRLQRAAQLLKRKSGAIADIAKAVGFSNSSHFSTSFRAKYGVSPTRYLTRETRADVLIEGAP